MKILFLNYEYPPLGGGAGNATAYLLREYAKMPDLEVHLVTSSVDAAYHHVAIGEQVTVSSVPIGKHAQNLHSQSLGDILMYAFVGYRFARALAKRERFDVIHAFFGIPCGSMARQLSRRYAIPYIVSLRGADVPGYSERFTVIYFFLRSLIRGVWHAASAVVSNSEGLRELALRTDPQQPISVIPNGIDTQEFQPAEKKENDGYIRILCVSRLTQRKGIRYLLEAIRLLSEDKQYKLKLWIAGEGEEMFALKELAQKLGIVDKIKFFGRVAHERLAVYYQRADIFCLPSLNEGMSNTLLEALSAGMPVVTTVTGGTAELVRDGENGFCVAQRSAKDLAEKLKVLIDDEALRKRFGRKSRTFAEYMSWKNVALAYKDVYQKIGNAP